MPAGSAAVLDAAPDRIHAPARLCRQIRVRGVAALDGVGAATAARLAGHGIHTIADLAATPTCQLVSAGGAIFATLGARARHVLRVGAVPVADEIAGSCADVLIAGAAPWLVLDAVAELASLLDDRVLVDLPARDLVAG